MKQALFLILITWIPSMDLKSQIPCIDSLIIQGIDSFPCANLELYGHLSISEMGGGSPGNEIWGWTDIISGREFVLFGLNTGTAFIEITDALNPTYLGRLPTHTANSSWRDMKTLGHYAFIVSEAGGHGIQVFDMRRLLNVASPPSVFTADAHHASLGGSAHNIVGFEEGNLMIVVGARGGNCDGGFDVYDVSDPLNISYVTCYEVLNNSYVHDAFCVVYKGLDSEHVGKDICIGSNEDVQAIVDITDKGAIETLSELTYPQERYTHQSWITDDHQFVIFNDELDERNITSVNKTRSHMMDIRDLDSPIYMGFYEHPTSAIDHNAYIRGQYVYQTNYEAGLRILNITQIADSILTEEAFFDTTPNNTRINFNGTWGNYPFFSSGIVPISDRSTGLYLLKPTLPHFILETNENKNEACPGETLTFPIVLKPMHGFSDNVDLTLSNIPPGVSSSLSSSTLSPGDTAILTITDTESLSGAYSFVVEGNGVTTSAEHKLAFLIEVEPITENIVIQDFVFMNSTLIEAANNITLDRVVVDSNCVIQLMSPSASFADSLHIRGNGSLIYKMEDPCLAR